MTHFLLTKRWIKQKCSKNRAIQTRKHFCFTCMIHFFADETNGSAKSTARIEPCKDRNIFYFFFFFFPCIIPFFAEETKGSAKNTAKNQPCKNRNIFFFFFFFFCCLDSKKFFVP